MNPLLFAIIAGFGVLYYVGWLINIGVWNSQKKVPEKATLWLPLLIGLAFVAVDIYGFTIFPNGTPQVGLPLAAILAHFLLFLGGIIQASKLGKHRCPKCGRWAEIEKETSETDIEEAYTITITKRCSFCDYEETKTKTSTDGVGHIATLPSIYITSNKEKKDSQNDDVERINADEIESGE